MEDLKSVINRLTWRVIQHSIFDNYRPKICHTLAYSIRGRAKGGEELSTLVFASKKWVEYFLKLVYEGESASEYLGEVSFDEVSSLINSKPHDIALVSSNMAFSDFLLSKGFFVVPHIDFKLDISTPWNVIYKKMDRSLRRTINRIEERSFCYEVTQDRNKIELFYYKLYLPHVSEKYGKAARIVSLEECKRLSKNGGLFLLKTDERYVSGLIFSNSSSELNLAISGVNDDDLKDKAYYALRYFFIKWAMLHGYKRIDSGMSNPFFTDGTFMYKKKWGMQMEPIQGRSAGIFAVHFCNFSDGVKSFLLHNPFVFLYKGKLHGVVINYSGFNSLRKRYFVPGLSRLIILNSSNNLCDDNKMKLCELSFKKQFNMINNPLFSLAEIASKENYVTYFVDFENSPTLN
jgi:hypothetical protein